MAGVLGKEPAVAHGKTWMSPDDTGSERSQLLLHKPMYLTLKDGTVVPDSRSVAARRGRGGSCPGSRADGRRAWGGGGEMQLVCGPATAAGL